MRVEEPPNSLHLRGKALQLWRAVREERLALSALVKAVGGLPAHRLTPELREAYEGAREALANMRRL